jgi:hypothetical protein
MRFNHKMPTPDGAVARRGGLHDAVPPACAKLPVGRQESGDAVLQFRDRDREGGRGRGLQRLQPKPAQVLQQRADDRGSEAQHAEAIQQHVATLLAQGEPVPQNERLVHVEELSIGLP